MQQSGVYYQHCLNVFRAPLCPSSGKQRPCVTARGVLRCNKRENVDISCNVFFCGVVCSKASWNLVCICECRVPMGVSWCWTGICLVCFPGLVYRERVFWCMRCACDLNPLRQMAISTSHLLHDPASRTVTFTVLAPYNAASHNRYQPHSAEPAQHTTCSNTRLGLLKMGIMVPETCWESVDNKHLTVAFCWFSLSLHDLLTMHGHRNLKLVSITLTAPYIRATVWRTSRVPRQTLQQNEDRRNTSAIARTNLHSVSAVPTYKLYCV